MKIKNVIKETILYTVFFSIIIVAVCASVPFIQFNLDKKENLKENDMVLEQIVVEKEIQKKNKVVEADKTNVSIEKLKEINEDAVGFIEIPGTLIKRPVLFSTYADEYLKKDIYGQWAYWGSIFIYNDVDLQTPQDNIPIFGHASQKDRSVMFSPLLDYINEDFYLEHKYINFKTEYHDDKYEIIAVNRLNIADDGFNFVQEYFEDEADFNRFIDNAKQRTPFVTPSASYGDKLITLVTCDQSLDHDFGRVVVIAKKI